VSGTTGGLAEAIRERIEASEIAALLLAKTTVAAERNVELVLSEESRLPDNRADSNMLLTIIGNLIDNAIDAAIAGPHPARVDVRLVAGSDRTVTIEVADSGPGVPNELTSRIFTDGFTTKSGDERRHRGIGLALTRRLVTRAGGAITVDCSGTTTFTVVLPAAPRPDPVGSARSGAAGRIEVAT
jgi:two-component system, CitB family, sensor kinase